MDARKNGSKIFLRDKHQRVITSCTLACSFYSRFKGLLGTRELAKGDGLLLYPCNSVHMWGMKIPIDVAFLSPVASVGAQGAGREAPKFSTGEQWRVEKLVLDWKPWSLIPEGSNQARAVLECASGTLSSHSISEGDILCIA